MANDLLDALNARIAQHETPVADGTNARAVDADTVAVEGRDRTVRLQGVDAPERAKVTADGFSRGEPGAEEARSILQKLLNREPVDVQDSGKNSYKRDVGTVSQSGKPIGVELVERGAAFPTGRWASKEERAAVRVLLARTNGIGAFVDNPEARADALRMQQAFKNDPNFRFSPYKGRPGFQNGNNAFTGAVARGTDNMQASLYAAANAVGELTGMDAMAAWGERGMQENMLEAAINPAKIESYDDIHSFADVGTYVVEAFGENLTNLATMATGGGTAATIARAALGKALVKRAAMVGAAVPSYGMAVGETQQELKEGGITAPGTALIAGVPITGLDLFGFNMMLGKAFGKMAIKSAKDVVKQAAEGFGIGFANEMPTEAAQELVTMAARAMHDPNYELFSEENRKRLINAGLKGGIVGGGVGGISSTARAGFEFLRGEANSRQGSTSDEGGDPNATSAPAGTQHELDLGTPPQQGELDLQPPSDAPPPPGPGPAPEQGTLDLQPPGPTVESQQTIDGHADAVRDGTSAKDSLIVTPGSPEPTNVEGLGERIETPDGVVFTTNPEKAATVKQLVANPQQDMFGLQQTLSEILFNLPGGKPEGGDRVVSAEDKDGNPVAEIVANAKTEADAIAAAAEQAPAGGSVRTRTPEAVLSDRQERVDAEAADEAFDAQDADLGGKSRTLRDTVGLLRTGRGINVSMRATKQALQGVLRAMGRTPDSTGERGNVNLAAEPGTFDARMERMKTRKSRRKRVLFTPEILPGDDEINDDNRNRFQTAYPEGTLPRTEVAEGYKFVRALSQELTTALGIGAINTHIMMENAAHGVALMDGNDIGIDHNDLRALGQALMNKPKSLRARLRAASTVETLYHELGHMLQKRLLSVADEASVREIEEAYQDWLSKRVGKNAMLAMISRKGLAGKVRDLMTLSSRTSPEKAFEDEDYAVQFAEWWADQVAKYMSARLANKEVVGVPKAIRDFGEMLLGLYKTLKEKLGVAGLPAPSVKKFLDNHMAHVSQHGPKLAKPNKGEAAQQTALDVNLQENENETAIHKAFREAAGVPEGYTEDPTPESADGAQDTETTSFTVTTAAARLTVERIFPNAVVEGPKGGPWTVTEELPPSQVRGEDIEAPSVRQALAKALDDGRTTRDKRMEFIDTTRTLKNGKHPKVRVNAQGLISLGLRVEGKSSKEGSEVERLRNGLLAGLAYMYDKGFRPSTEKSVYLRGRISMQTFRGEGTIEPHQWRALMVDLKGVRVNRIGIPLDFVVYTTKSKRDLTVADLLHADKIKNMLVEQRDVLTEMLRTKFAKRADLVRILRKEVKVRGPLAGPLLDLVTEKLRQTNEVLSDVFGIKPEVEEFADEEVAQVKNKAGKVIRKITRKREQDGLGTRQTYDPTRAGKVLRRTQSIEDRIENPGVERKRVDNIPDAAKIDEANEEAQAQSFENMEPDATQAERSAEDTLPKNARAKEFAEKAKAILARQEQVTTLSPSLGDKAGEVLSSLMQHLGLKNRLFVADEQGLLVLIDNLKAQRLALRTEYQSATDDAERTKIAAQGAEINAQVAEYEDILRESPPARIVYNDKRSQAKDRVPLIFVSENVIGKRAQMVKLAHELGHLIQRVALDTAPKDVQDALREALGTEHFAENFANQLIKWVDRRTPARNIVDKFFKGLRDRLQDMWYYLRTQGGVYRLDGTFAEFMDSLVVLRTQREGGKPATLLGRRFVKHLDSFVTGPYLPYRTDGETRHDFTLPAGVKRAGKQAMSTRRGQTVVAVGKNWAKVWNVMLNLGLRSNDAYLRAIKSPTVQWIADQWHKRAGDAKNATPIPDEIRMFKGPFLDKLRDIVAKLPKTGKIKAWQDVDVNSPKYAELYKLLVDQTTKAEFLARGDEIGEIGAAVRDFMDGIHAKMTGQYGVKVKKRNGYFPMIIDMNKWMHAKDRAITLMLDNGVSRTEAEEFYQYIVKVNGTALDSISVTDETLAPGFRFKKRHQYFAYIKDEFLVDDIHTAMAFYLHAAARRSVIENRFRMDAVLAKTPEAVKNMTRWKIDPRNPVAGLQYKLAEAFDKGEISGEQYHHIKAKILEGNLGRLGAESNPVMKRVSAGLMLYQNVRLLSMAVLTSLVDPGQTLWRSDMNFRSNITAFREVVLNKLTREEHYKMARLMGIIEDDVTDHVLNDQLNTQFLGPDVRKWNERFFKAILMNQWTNVTRVMAMRVGKDYLVDHAQKARGGNAESVRRLQELGVSADRVLDWDSQGQPLTDFEDIVSGISTFVDEAIIRPDSSVRPWWASDPRFMLVFHLKSFMWGYHEQVLRRMWAETKNRPALMKAIPMLTLMAATLPLAMLGYETRRRISWFPNGVPEHTEKDGWEYFQELAQRSGYLGIMQLYVDAEQAEEFGKFSVLSVLGPTFDQMGEFLTKDFDYVALRATPLLAQSGAARAWIRNQ